MGFCTVSVGTSFSADFAGMVLVDSDSLAVLLFLSGASSGLL